MVTVWQSILGQDSISMTDDFFKELGGHSLLAAQTVSKLRAVPGFESVSVGDLYANPTVEKLTAKVHRLAPAAATGPAERAAAHHSVSTLQYLACTALQLLGVLFVSGIYAWQWLGAFFTYGYLTVTDRTLLEALVLSLAVYAVTTPAVLILSILLKWILLGRVVPGRYPLWGFYYFRFWLARAVMRAAPVRHLTGTPFLPLYYRLMGARIGRNVFLGSQLVIAFDVLTIGDDSSIGMESGLDASSVEGGMLRIAPIRIGKRCMVGNRAFLGCDTVMEDGSGLGNLSMLPDSTTIPAGQLWCRALRRLPQVSLSPKRRARYGVRRPRFSSSLGCSRFR